MAIGVAVTAGLAFSFSISLTMFLLIQNAKRGIYQTRPYLVPLLSMGFTANSLYLLIKQICLFGAFITCLIAGAVFCLLTLVVIYAMLYCFDREYLRKLLPKTQKHVPAKGMLLFLTSVISAVSITALLGWFLLICFTPS